MQLRIDREASAPLVQQIVEGVSGWMRGNRVRAGTRVPSIRQLARENRLSQSSVIEAYDRLVALGLLESRHGSGFFVAEAPAANAELDSEWQEGGESAWGQFSGASTQLKLGCGWVPDSWREVDQLSYAIRQVTRSELAGLFDYSTPLGLPTLRQHIQKRLRLIDIHVHQDQILTTTGASHALDLLVRTLLEPGDVVVVENPGYYNLFNLLKFHGVKMVGVPRGRNGPDIAALEAILQAHRPKFLFINSMYHNPTGTSLSPPVAHRVLQLAEMHDFHIIEDDIYADFQNGPGTRLATLDSLRRVIYLASFSKTLSCSLRVGYLVASPELIRRLADVKMYTSIGSQRFAECVVCAMLANGSYRKLVQRLRQRLTRHMAAALRVLEDNGWEVFAEPVGGMFVWARIGERGFAELQAQATRLGVLLSPGSAFSPEGEESDWLRINIAYAGDPRALAFFEAFRKRA
ncbi:MULTISPECIES: PLP-dependent aminotransferase family protein [Pseudomonas aeruginosa group]|uniref:aminotransferase-like domain-containing protein n=1 Tax=Pseudomonas aeruginosa group TaxID=136841 RepID=UPI00210E5F8C|nr:PLP-dependent aminotransferase family protein [Pseudomonas aeruginosa]MCW8024226.1 PLP-dependent aminotransferase family protein [Pseudomonas aeruginosa]